MNYLQLSQDTWEKIGATGLGPQSVTNQSGISLDVVTWVKDAWLDIQSEEKWNFLRNDVTVSLGVGVNEIVVAPTSMVSIDVTSGWIDGAPFTWLPYGEFLRRFPTIGNGQPSVASLVGDGRTIRFNSKPVTAASVHYLGWKPAVSLTIDADTPVIPVQYHRLIVYRAVMLYAIREEAVSLYSGAKAIADDIERRMMTTELDQVQKATGYYLA